LTVFPISINYDTVINEGYQKKQSRKQYGTAAKQLGYGRRSAVLSGRAQLCGIKEHYCRIRKYDQREHKLMQNIFSFENNIEQIYSGADNHKEQC
jgi:hypothetical protein